MTTSYLDTRRFSYILFLYLLIKFSTLILSRTTLQILEIYLSKDIAGSVFWVLGRLVPGLEPAIGFLDYVIIFLFCIAATPILAQGSGLHRIYNPSSLQLVTLSGICYLTFIFSIWFGRVPFFLEDLGMNQQLLIVLVMNVSVIFVIFLLPLLFGVIEIDVFRIRNFDSVEIRETISYSILFAAGMALILRLGGFLEIAVLIYLTIKFIGLSKNQNIDLEKSILNLLSGINSGSKRFAVGFLILTGVYLGTQTVIHVRLQLTILYTIFHSNAEITTFLLFITGFGVSIFFAAVAPMWWLQRPKSAENFSRIVSLYSVLLLQLFFLHWLGTFVETVPGNSELTLQNPSVFSVLLAGSVVGYTYLRTEISTNVGSSILALIAIVFLGRILFGYPVMTDVVVLAWCALSYWVPPLMRFLGRKYGFLLNLI